MTRSIKNLMAAVLIAVSGYLAWTQVLPAYYIISYLRERIEEKSNILTSRVEIIEQIKKLRQESEAKYSELQRLALVVPEKRDFPEIITAVENIYSRSGFILEELVIGDVKEPGQLGKISLKTGASGTYNQFFNFLNYLEKNIRLLDINKLEVGLPRETGGVITGGDSKDPELVFEIEGQFYWLRPMAENVQPATVP